MRTSGCWETPALRWCTTSTPTSSWPPAGGSGTEALKTAALAQKAWREDPAALPLDELLAMGTVNGASALGLNSGKVEEGALADLILVDTASPFFVPAHNFKANFIYSANSSCIDTLICGGRILMQGGRVEGQEEILARAREETERFLRKINA